MRGGLRLRLIRPAPLRPGMPGSRAFSPRPGMTSNGNTAILDSANPSLYNARRSSRPRFKRGPGAQVAQLVEHVTENHGVGGSIPPLGTTCETLTTTILRPRSLSQLDCASMIVRAPRRVRKIACAASRLGTASRRFCARCCLSDRSLPEATLDLCNAVVQLRA
jgi:hypothetical protein